MDAALSSLFRGDEDDVDALIVMLVDQFGEEFTDRDIHRRAHRAMDALIALRCVEEAGSKGYWGESCTVFAVTNRGRRGANNAMTHKTVGYRRYVAWLIANGYEAWIDDDWAAAKMAEQKRIDLAALADKTRKHGLLNRRRAAVLSQIVGRTNQLRVRGDAYRSNPIFGLL